jgi:hypothetical protein
MRTDLHKSWSAESFLAWAVSQATRYEFDVVQPVAMTGAGLGICVPVAAIYERIMLLRFAIEP